MKSNVFLKVKIKSLMDEARIIRKEEAKNKKLRHNLAQHRREVVGVEARHTMLAYGFLRGKSYLDLEPNSKSTKRIDWDKVRSMVKRLGFVIVDWSGDDIKETSKLINQALADFDKWIPKN